MVCAFCLLSVSESNCLFYSTLISFFDISVAFFKHFYIFELKFNFMDIYQVNFESRSDAALLLMLGEFIKETRMQQGKTQLQLAREAGINRGTLVKLEQGHGANLLSFIQVLRSLQVLQTLQALEFRRQISPLLLAEAEVKLRKRASKNKGNKSKPSPW